MIERACILADGDFITERELSVSMPSVSHVRERTAGSTPASALQAQEADLLVNVEREHIQRALARAGGNKKAAAKMLGLSRRALYRRLERLDLGGTITRRRDGADVMIQVVGERPGVVCAGAAAAHAAVATARAQPSFSLKIPSSSLATALHRARTSW